MMPQEKLERIRYVTKNYNRLRGLMWLPWGVLCILYGTLQLLAPNAIRLQRFPPFDLLFVILAYGVVVVYPVQYILKRYYTKKLGFVRPIGEKASVKPKASIMVYLLWFIIFLPGLIGLFHALGLVVRLFGIFQVIGVWFLLIPLFAVAKDSSRKDYLFISAICVVFAGILIFEIFPLTVQERLSSTMSFVGVLLILVGVLDHRFLVTTLKPQE